MFLELSEAFVCPDCRPAQGLVVLVDRIEGRRVVRGRLGCPECDLRVPILEEVVRFDRSGRGEEAESGDRPEAAGHRDRDPDGDPWERLGAGGAEEGATVLAALLGAEAVEGYLLLGPGLAPLAPGVAERASSAEVLALTHRPREPAHGVTWAVHPGNAPLPLFTGRLAGAALLGVSGSEASEAVRVVRTGGRVVLAGPDGEALRRLGELPAEEVAGESGIVVLERREGGFEEPFARFRGGPRPRGGEP